ncbi:multisubunit sodium/proton antiporter, MrpF subunit [Modicisalibacter ilicicola DSM 19980]|uniref:Multisubunit sodium/proton antiporter, MrpF subunit n=1 Tax=Modicisalibacter ilicicola DSM 19980 TaxID=1121942 RepID=A0A1M4ZQM8_9GAMM|nr:monovalent cation/H+ antiporter complex subunit F [Halomonas ilicicola]SHF20107.1 multisubunit sodium/proton antiporter, MrpF subunit [Halomonas ilicicola DSM 19980]
MNTYLTGLAILLLITLLIGLIRVFRGPSRADRMLAAQLFGTTGVAMMLILGIVTDLAALFDVALVMGILASITSIAFIRLAGDEQ